MFDDKIIIKPVDLKPLPADLKLRDVQIKLFDNMIKSYRAGYRRQMCMSPTGSGKSVWAATLFHRILSKNNKARLMFVVPRNTLINQILKDFNYILQTDVGIIQGNDERFNLSYAVQIATIQTLGNRLRDYPDLFKDFDCVVVDEAHLRFKAVENIDTKWLVGLSATPMSKGLANVYDDLVRTTPAYKLAQQGVITPMRVLAARKQIDHSKLKVLTTGEYSTRDEDKQVESLTGDVLTEYENNPDMEGRPFLGFAKSIKSCVHLAELFQNAGHNVGYVHSKMSHDDCEAVLKSLKDGLLIGVFSVIKLIEGFDYPEASAILLCTAFAPDKDGHPSALGRWIQLHGRARRSDPNNPDKVAIIHDHGGNWERYSHPDVYEAEFTELCDGKKKERDDKPKASDVKQSECPECHHFFTGGQCNYCGYKPEKYTQFVNGQVMRFEHGKMVEIVNNKSTKHKKKKPDKQEMYSGLLHEIMELNQRRMKQGKMPVNTKGMAAHKFREVFGVFPKGLQQVSRYSEQAHNYMVHSFIRYRNRSKSMQS